MYIYSTRSLLSNHIIELNECFVVLIHESKQKSGARLLTPTVVHVSECYHGSVHDITVLRESGLLEHAEESVQIIGDKEYIGEEYVVTPKKKPRGRELI